MATLTTTLIALTLTSAAQAHTPPANVKRAICHAFGPHCHEAIQVAGCETGYTYSPYARNGRYWGLFQVSDHWRRTIPGFAWNIWAQARHAYKVFVLTGRTWRHWDCQP